MRKPFNIQEFSLLMSTSLTLFVDKNPFRIVTVTSPSLHTMTSFTVDGCRTEDDKVACDEKINVG